MATTFVIRPRKDKRLQLVQIPEAGDICLDFNVSPEGAKDVQDFLNNLITTVEVQPGLRSIYSDSENGWWLWVIGLLFFALFLDCAGFLYFHHQDFPFLSLGLAAAWTVLVPTYFFIEHEVLFFYRGDHAQYEQFKRVQDLAAKIWAGAVAVLGAILAIKL